MIFRFRIGTLHNLCNNEKCHFKYRRYGCNLTIMLKIGLFVEAFLEVLGPFLITGGAKFLFMVSFVSDRKK